MTSYHPGHHMHPIQARLAGESPWGWRAGLVRSYRELVAVIDYVDEDGSITLWHATDLGLVPGTPVRVHESYHVLEVGLAWLSYERRDGGLGSVPEPAHPDLWAPERSTPITAVATGVSYRGDLPQDPPTPRSRPV